MRPPLTIFLWCTLLFSMIFFCSCNSRSDKKQEEPQKDTSKKVIKKVTIPVPEVKYQRPPIVNIVDTVSPKRLIIYCKDSAATFERISLKLGKVYGTKLAEYIKKNNLKVAGAPLAWYKKLNAPYFFEAGIPVNKKGTKKMTGVQLRELSSGKAIVAHFYGPFDLLPEGYDAIKEFIKDNKKIAAGAPYEIYVTDPFDKNGKPIDPYKIQTDIVFPIK